MYLVVVYYALCYGFVEHLLVPLLQSLGLWDLLIQRMAVEDVVIALARRASPDVTSGVTGQNRNPTRVKTSGSLLTSRFHAVTHLKL